MAVENDPIDGQGVGTDASEDSSLLDTIRSAVDSQRSSVATDAPEPGEAAEAGEISETGVPRDPLGRFAPKTATPEAPKPEEVKEAEAAPEPEKADPAQTQALRPPPGFSVASKQAWDQLPEVVRADIAKRESEIDAGMRRYAGLGKFAEAAERNNRSIGEVVASYVETEGLLRRDFLGGLEYLTKEIGVDPIRLAQAMAVKHLGIHPSTLDALRQQQAAATGQTETQPRQEQRQLDPEQIAAQVYDRVHGEFEERRIASDIAEFESKPEHRFFSNVRSTMAVLVGSGEAADLEQAYQAACWMNPEIRALLISEQAQTGARKETQAVDRAKAAAKAVGGAPSGGVPGDTGDTGASLPDNASVMDTIKFAMSRQIGV